MTVSSSCAIMLTSRGTELTMPRVWKQQISALPSAVVAMLQWRLQIWYSFNLIIVEFRYFLPAGTFCELWPILFPVFFGLPQPLSSIEMIIISMLTDCVASMSLIKEKPEADLLLRPPRRPSKDRLTNAKLLFQAYFILGVPMLVCANAMAFRVFARAGIPFSSLWMSYGKIVVDGVPVDSHYFQEVLNQAQSTYFLTLVLMHWGCLMMIRTRRLSLIQHPPIGSKKTRNLYLFGAMLITVSMMLLFILTSFFQKIFRTRAVSVEYWFIRTCNVAYAANVSAWVCLRSHTVGRNTKIFRSSVPERISCKDRVVGAYFVLIAVIYCILWLTVRESAGEKMLRPERVVLCIYCNR